MKVIQLSFLIAISQWLSISLCVHFASLSGCSVHIVVILFSIMILFVAVLGLFLLFFSDCFDYICSLSLHLFVDILDLVILGIFVNVLHLFAVCLFVVILCFFVVILCLSRYFGSLWSCCVAVWSFYVSL